MYAGQLHHKTSATYVQTHRLAIYTIPLTVASVAQGWQYKACPVPEHNAGPLTVRLAIFFLALGALCVGGRFVARWRIQNASIGVDDWSILLSYILMIPATVLIILSKISKVDFIALVVLTLYY